MIYTIGSMAALSVIIFTVLCLVFTPYRLEQEQRSAIPATPEPVNPKEQSIIDLLDLFDRISSKSSSDTKHVLAHLRIWAVQHVEPRIREAFGSAEANRYLACIERHSVNKDFILPIAARSHLLGLLDKTRVKW